MYARQGALYIRRIAWALPRAPVIAVQHGQSRRGFPASSATGGEPCAGRWKTRLRLTSLDFPCDAVSGYQPNDGRMEGGVAIRARYGETEYKGKAPAAAIGFDGSASAAGRYT